MSLNGSAGHDLEQEKAAYEHRPWPTTLTHPLPEGSHDAFDRVHTPSTALASPDFAGVMRIWLKNRRKFFYD
jgi:hypothetical protein